MSGHLRPADVPGGGRCRNEVEHLAARHNKVLRHVGWNEWSAQRANWYSRHGVDSLISKRTFIAKSGRRCHKCGLTNDGGEYRYNFHMLRHGGGSLFIAVRKWSPKCIQAVMGHANVALTFDLYGHLFEDPAVDREDMKK